MLVVYNEHSLSLLQGEIALTAKPGNFSEQVAHLEACIAASLEWKFLSWPRYVAD